MNLKPWIGVAFAALAASTHGAPIKRQDSGGLIPIEPMNTPVPAEPAFPLPTDCQYGFEPLLNGSTICAPPPFPTAPPPLPSEPSDNAFTAGVGGGVFGLAAAAFAGIGLAFYRRNQADLGGNVPQENFEMQDLGFRAPRRKTYLNPDGTSKYPGISFVEIPSGGRDNEDDSNLKSYHEMLWFIAKENPPYALMTMNPDGDGAIVRFENHADGYNCPSEKLSNNDWAIVGHLAMDQETNQGAYYLKQEELKSYKISAPSQGVEALVLASQKPQKPQKPQQDLEELDLAGSERLSGDRVFLAKDDGSCEVSYKPASAHAREGR